MTHTPSTPSSTAPPVDVGIEGRQPLRGAAGRRPCPPPSPPASNRARAKTSPAAARSAPSSVLSATLPVNPSVTMTSTVPCMRSRPSTLPTNPARSRAARTCCLRSSSPLPGLLAVREEPDRGLVDPEAGTRVLAAHAGELGEPLRGAVDGRPAVDEQLVAGACRHGDRDRDGGPRRSRGSGPCAAAQPPWSRRCSRRRPWRGRAPSRTAWAVRTSDESFLRRAAAAGSSSMAMTSAACSMSMPADSAVGKQRLDRVRPARRAARRRRARSTASSAPRTISPGRVVAAHGVDRDGDALGAHVR